MERLTIENFGPIKKAEIDLKKINVFIGPQGSGKSTIAKIISALRSYHSWSSEEWFFSDMTTKLQEDYNLRSFFNKNTKIRIKTEGVEINISGESPLLSILNEPLGFYGAPESIYVPAERTLVPLIAESSFLFIREKTPIAKYITDFGILFQKARTQIKSRKFDFLGDLAYSFEDNADLIRLKDGKVLNLKESSNGIQTIVPLLLTIDSITSVRKNEGRKIAISIEEPELSLFPVTQNNLLKFIIEKLHPLNYSLTITTHSPYTLTTLNNLIYAFQVGKANNEVQNIVPEHLWLDPDDLGAWFVENGTVRSIIDEENQQIQAEEIDKISETLNQEYDQIMDIKFKQKN